MFVINFKLNFKKILIICCLLGLAIATIVEFSNMGTASVNSKKDSAYDFLITENNWCDALKTIHENIDENVNKTVKIKGFVFRMPDFKENYFVGHIGGDDFIAIVPSLDIDKICQLIIANFDEGVTKFFTEEDLEKGYIEVANRKGIIEQFALTSISIGAVIADKNRFANILEIGEVGAQVKHVAKSIVGSSYATDRRHEKE